MTNNINIDWKALEDQYEAATYARYPVVFTHGEGIYLFDIDGKKYTDLYGGHCVSILGHSPQRVIDAIHEQSKQLMFYSNVIYHPSRGKAARKLIEMAPEGFDKVFFCNSGTEANENAIKLAWKITGKTRIVSTIGGWHGRTLASLSVTHSEKLRLPYRFAMPDVSFVPFGNASALREFLSMNTDVAGFIIEPIQSINGCNMAEDAYYQDVRAICDEYGVLLIFDEIQTGVGRTGTFSFCEHVNMKPDIITLAKSLAAGFPIGAVLMPDRIAGQLSNGDLGSTFAGGMLASAACEATLEEIDVKNHMAHAPLVFNTLLEALKDTPIEIRGRGCLIGLKLPVEAKTVVRELFHRGWITGTSDVADVMRIMPPIITPTQTIEEFAKELIDVISK
ncbi:MAG: aspartate aminotransferase family protein [Bacteroidetes bacterium]|nr:aspartate aminotransferase family protein [Bacteroidota bacterium]